jgi:glycosyltransferase involved in cell wall biosynthesis
MNSASWVDEALARIEQANPWYRIGERTRTPKLEGVNVWGYLRDESGWGAAARGYVRALRRLGVPLALYDLSDSSTNRSGDTSLGVIGEPSTYDVNLVCVDPTRPVSALGDSHVDLFNGRYNIGAWAWELPSVPSRWYDRFAFFDEIWATTSFVVDAFATIAPIPVVRIPPVLEPIDLGSRDKGRTLLAAGTEYVFLFTFDFHSHIKRKNPLGLVAAFHRAFEDSDAVRLVLKSVNAESDPEGRAALSAIVDGRQVQLRDGYWSAEAMRDLMAGCDAYVSLHRSEGTGLTIADAMAHGKPTIATDWSGNTDFMSTANSFPVRYELTTLMESVGPYERGGIWAEPSVEHASQLMRDVFERREFAERIGARAQRDIRQRYSETAVATQIEQRLRAIAGRSELPALRREARRFHNAYAALTAAVRETVEALTPAGSRIVVISRGDAALVAFSERFGSHFPQGNDGEYAGYHPPDSEWAIAHLRELQEGGAEYLLLPGTARWWLNHYAGFRHHLDSNCELVSDDAYCVLYRLESPDNSHVPPPVRVADAP